MSRSVFADGSERMPEPSLEDAKARAARRPTTYIIDIYGLSVRYGHGSWLATSTIIALMADLGVDAQAVRSALSRMKRKRVLTSHVVGRRRGHALTDATLEILQEGDSRIFQARAPSDLEDGWVLVVFSIPEDDRGKRHLLRSRLEGLGFGNQAPGVWIAPARLADDVRRLVTRLELAPYVSLFESRYLGFASARDLVRRAWDLEQLTGMHDRYIADYAPVAAKWANRPRPVDGTEAFADLVTALHEWRRFPYLDPGLPPELLLDPWSGHRAADVFFTILELLEPAVIAHVRAALARSTARK